MLDPDIARLLERQHGARPSEELGIAELRAAMAPVPVSRRRPVASVEDRRLPGGLPVRFYRPLDRRRRQLIVYFHGGGFVSGSVETHDQLCRDLCSAGGCTVMSADYRLAPEHKFPAAIDDALAATRWALAHAETVDAAADEIVVAGDSAGATLAIVTAIRLRDAGGPQVAGQLLAYPVAAYHTPATRSYLDCATGYGLTRAAMIRFWGEYLPDPSMAAHPHAAPLNSSSLGDLPPTLIVTAEFDPLRDEGQALAAALARQGNAVDSSDEPGLIHGFLRTAPDIAPTRRVFARMGEWLQRLPSRRSTLP